MADHPLLSKLKTRLSITDTSEDTLLNDLLAEANAEACAAAEVTTLPDTHSFIVTRLAAIEYRQLGLEGEKSHSEGGESHGIDLLPEHLKGMLLSLHIAKVVDT